MQHITEEMHLQSLVDAQVFGSRNEWEKHEFGAKKSFVKALRAADPYLKAQIAKRYDEMGFVPVLFREAGQDFVALEEVKQGQHYHDVEAAFAAQILSKL